MITCNVQSHNWIGNYRHQLVEMDPKQAFKKFCEDLYSSFMPSVVALTETSVTIKCEKYNGEEVEVTEYVGCGNEMSAIVVLAALEVLCLYWSEELSDVAKKLFYACIAHVDPQDLRPADNCPRPSRSRDHARELEWLLEHEGRLDFLGFVPKLSDVLAAYRLGKEYGLSISKVYLATNSL